jgi:tripartite-type tricarboxylate transporter receptor subunit TctC
MKRHLLPVLLVSAGIFAAVAAPSACADAWPNKPLRLIVPFPPGGAADVVGRIYGEKLSLAFKQPVVIENKPGAGTAIAAEAAAKAAPDGYTLSLAPAGQLTVLPHLNKSLPYDPVKDFAPVSLLASVPYVIGARPALAADNVKELVALAKKDPGKLTYSSCGNGTLCHLTGELFKSQTGTDLLHIPYKGSAPAVTALLGGEVDLAFDTLTVLAPQAKAGKIKALAITSSERSPLLPNVPTASESGLPHFEASSWFGLVVPAATPKEIVRQINAELKKIAQLPDVREKLASQGLDTLNSTPEKFEEIIRDDYAKWGKVVRASGAKLD